MSGGHQKEGARRGKSRPSLASDTSTIAIPIILMINLMDIDSLLLGNAETIAIHRTRNV